MFPDASPVQEGDLGEPGEQVATKGQKSIHPSGQPPRGVQLDLSSLSLHTHTLLHDTPHHAFVPGRHTTIATRNRSVGQPRGFGALYIT